MPSDAVTTPAAAEAEIASKLGDADFQAKYNDRHHDGHTAAVAEMTHLHRVAAGEAEPSDDKPADQSVDAVGDAELQAAEAEMEDEYGAGWQSGRVGKTNRAAYRRATGARQPSRSGPRRHNRQETRGQPQLLCLRQGF